MTRFKRATPSVNSGSMADIAFLLLIFFLVTTTISADKGILRQLPPECPPNQDCTADIAKRNILNVFINKRNQLMVDDHLTDISELKVVAMAFIDNNGDGSCSYCHGAQNTEASDNPKEAVVSLQHAASTTYGTFISVQDEISKAYDLLRKDYAMATYNKSLDELSKTELQQVKAAYPFKLSEAKTRVLSQ